MNKNRERQKPANAAKTCERKKQTQKQEEKTGLCPEDARKNKYPFSCSEKNDWYSLASVKNISVRDSKRCSDAEQKGLLS